MGIDAEMYIDVPRVLTADEVLAESRHLTAAFGHERFWFYDRDGKLAHALSISGEDDWRFEDSGLKKSAGHTVIRVSLGGRYYGKSYARGDGPFYIQVAEFLERRLKGTVYYGGDSGGAYLRTFDVVARAELWDYFVTYEHAPYQSYFSDNLGDGDLRPPDCERCRVRPIQCGFSITGYSAFRCRSCDYQVNSHDFGTTWSREAK